LILAVMLGFLTLAQPTIKGDRQSYSAIADLVGWVEERNPTNPPLFTYYGGFCLILAVMLGFLTLAQPTIKGDR
jgi:hypothetical protein